MEKGCAVTRGAPKGCFLSAGLITACLLSATIRLAEGRTLSIGSSLDTTNVTSLRGAILEATLPKPTDIPPAPANAAEPVVIRTQPALTR